MSRTEINQTVLMVCTGMYVVHMTTPLEEKKKRTEINLTVLMVCTVCTLHRTTPLEAGLGIRSFVHLLFAQNCSF